MLLTTVLHVINKDAHDFRLLAGGILWWLRAHGPGERHVVVADVCLADVPVVKWADGAVGNNWAHGVVLVCLDVHSAARIKCHVREVSLAWVEDGYSDIGGWRIDETHAFRDWRGRRSARAL